MFRQFNTYKKLIYGASSKFSITSNNRLMTLSLSIWPLMSSSRSTHSYIHTLEQLNRFKRGKLDLSNSLQLAAHFNNPHKDYNIIHVTGTNGKGSVVTKLAKCLQLLGYKVGSFTSPHILSFRERFLIGNTMIDEQELIDQIQEVFNIAAVHKIEPTFFEVCTQIAFNYFSKNKVDWAIIEVGIGGRLDATNIIESPRATVITSIGNDHIPVLGNTLEEIAIEKSGIFKEGCPVILGPTVTQFPAIFKKAKDLNCPIYQVQSDPRGLTFDEENQKISQMTIEKALNIEMPNSLLNNGLMAKPPLRFHLLSNSEITQSLKYCLKKFPSFLSPSTLPFQIIIDVGHNETALERLCQDIGHRFPGYPIRICVSQSQNRTLDLFLPLLNYFSFPENNRLMGIHFLTCNHMRLKDYETFFKELPILQNSDVKEAFTSGMEFLTNSFSQVQSNITNKEEIYKSDNFERLVHLILLQAAKEQSILLFCGTFFFTKNVTESLGLDLGVVDPIEISDPPVTL